jgi:hypothetical protein
MEGGMKYRRRICEGEIRIVESHFFIALLNSYCLFFLQHVVGNPCRQLI